jgi:hypothetical protein
VGGGRIGTIRAGLEVSIVFGIVWPPRSGVKMDMVTWGQMSRSALVPLNLVFRIQFM